MPRLFGEAPCIDPDEGWARVRERMRDRILLDAEGRVAAKGLVNDAIGVDRLVRQAKMHPAPERAEAASPRTASVRESG